MRVTSGVTNDRFLQFASKLELARLYASVQNVDTHRYRMPELSCSNLSFLIRTRYCCRYYC